MVRTPFTARLAWGAAALLVGAALAWQVLYELGRQECLRDAQRLLALCSGPLDGWVLPVTLAAAMTVLGTGAWLLRARAGPAH